MTTEETNNEDRDDFDFVRECIRTYRLAGDDVEHRIKALALLQKVTLPAAPVKEDESSSTNRAAVAKAQDALRHS
tara:strand:- start:2 stop:226 length:225 start_codon:yes stop_codon:yes gene_type:complete